MAATGDQQPKRRSAAPMPSLIYNGGVLGADTPKQEAPPVRQPPPLKQTALSRYNRRTERLLLGAVAGIATIIGGLWLFAIVSQLSLVHWSQTPEKTLIDKTTYSWREAFHAGATTTVSIDELKTEIKDRLAQIAGQLASSPAPTSTATTTAAVAPSTTPSLATTTTIKLKP